MRGGGSFPHRIYIPTAGPPTPYTPPRSVTSPDVPSPMVNRPPHRPDTIEIPASPVISIAPTDNSMDPGSARGSSPANAPTSDRSREDFISPGSSPRVPQKIPRWTMDEMGFAEPTPSPKYAGQVISERQPPGWLAGRIRMASNEMFMSKVHKRAILLSGTKFYNGMRIWVDARGMKELKLANGDPCELLLDALNFAPQCFDKFVSQFTRTELLSRRRKRSRGRIRFPRAFQCTFHNCIESLFLRYLGW